MFNLINCSRIMILLRLFFYASTQNISFSLFSAYDYILHLLERQDPLLLVVYRFYT